jgi:phage recombination protein Bet
MNNETQWTDERIDLIKRTICPKGISTDAFMLFIEQCRRSGLDPLLKQAFCVERRQNIGTYDSPQWVNKHEFQPAEAGMLARAERFPDYEGVSAAEVFAEDPVSIDYGRGEVDHKVTPTQRKGALVGAWARVQRKGKVPTVVWVDFSEYVQKNGKGNAMAMWAKMPQTMIRKVARVAALRTAYPETFGGLYVAGERPDDVDTSEDAETPAPVTREKPALPPPAPRETLEVSKPAEKVPVARGTEDAQTEPAREPGSDDGVDEMEREVTAIAEAAARAETQADLAALKPRAMALPKGSPEYKRCAAALTEAFGRISKKGAA